MTEKLIEIEIDIDVTENNTQETPFAGLIPFIQMCNAMKLPEFINHSLHAQGTKGFMLNFRTLKSGLASALKQAEPR